MWDYLAKHAELFAALVTIMLGLGALFSMLYKVARKIDDTVTYVGELRTNHMPHIERVLRAVADHLGIDYD